MNLTAQLQSELLISKTRLRILPVYKLVPEGEVHIGYHANVSQKALLRFRNKGFIEGSISDLPLLFLSPHHGGQCKKQKNPFYVF
jgi:hypothetical protein